MSSTPLRTPRRLRTVLVTLVAFALLAGFGLVKLAEHREQERLSAEAHSRVLATARAAAADEAFVTARAVQANRAGVAVHVERHRAHTAAQVKKARAVLEDTRGKVADNAVREALARAVRAAEQSVPSALPSQLRGVEAGLAPAVSAVKKSNEAWTAEQERLAAERAAAAERARQAELERQRQAAAAAAAQSSSRGSSTTSSSTSSASSSTSSSSSAGKSTSTGSSSAGSSSSSSSKTDRARAILSRYGCGSAGIKWDDPRLGSMNGVADWYNNTVLLRSAMPEARFTYVVAHECVHLMQYRVYGGNVDALAADMNRIYGGSGFSGLEQNADCVTQRWGIGTYNYTRSCGGARGDAAAAIAAGRKP